MLSLLRVSKRTLLCLGMLLAVVSSGKGDKDDKSKALLKSAQVLDNYSFDFSAHQLPRAYDYFGAAI